MKTGFIQAMHALVGIENAEAKVALVATTDEETGSATSKELINRLSKDADAVLVFEASLDGKVKTGRKGTAMYQVKVTGLASHAGLDPEKGINATTEMAKLVLQIASLENPTFGTTAVPTVMKSGTTTNTVPALASLDIDVRSFTNAELERIDKSIRNLKSDIAKVEVTGGINRPPLEEVSTMALYEKLETVAASLDLPKIGNASVGGASDGTIAAAASGHCGSHCAPRSRRSGSRTAVRAGERRGAHRAPSVCPGRPMGHRDGEQGEDCRPPDTCQGRTVPTALCFEIYSRERLQAGDLEIEIERSSGSRDCTLRGL